MTPYITLSMPFQPQISRPGFMQLATFHIGHVVRNLLRRGAGSGVGLVLADLMPSTFPYITSHSMR